MDALEAMKAELKKMREEKKCMETWLIAAESALELKRRMVSEFKAMTKLADDLLCVIMEEGGDNVLVDIDEETIKELVEEAVRDFTLGLNEAVTRRSCSEDGGNGGAYDDSSGAIGGGQSE